MTEEIANRLAVLSRLVRRSPSQELGRTAMMKLTYFLTAVRNVPLGYRFSLYSYGPFDSTVLQDVDFASNLGALKSHLVRFPKGYGYAIQADVNGEQVEGYASDFLDTHEADIQWVIQEFGKLSAADLELASTIVYIDREADDAISTNELAKRVKDVKPHFTIEKILTNISSLAAKQLLTHAA